MQRPPLIGKAFCDNRETTVKKFSSVLLMLLVIISFSCARKEAEKATPLKGLQEPTPAERLAQAKEVFSAVENGNDKQLDQLLAQGADVNYRRPSDGATALHLIAQNGRAPIGGYLISGGADVNAKDNSGSAPLHWAAENGHLAVAKSLIDKGADVNAQRGDGATPLALAMSQGDAKMVEYLKRRGGKVNTNQQSQ
jgi:ankyrin repeat protein